MNKRHGLVAAAVALAAAGVAGATVAGAAPETQSERIATDTARKGDVTAMAFGYTHNWGPRAGWWRLRLNGLSVSAGQAVAVSVTECTAAGVEWIGDARFSVYNVAVENGAVTARIFVDSGSALGLCAHYVVS